MIKVGVIGSPSAVNRHISVLNRYQDVQIVSRWITEKDNKGMSIIDAKGDFSDQEKSLDNLDALIITETGSAFYKLAIKALKKAKFLFVYPTLVRSVSETSLLMKLAHEANVIVKVGKIGNINAVQIMEMIPGIKDLRLIELQHHLKFIGQGSENAIFDILLANLEFIGILNHAHVISIKAKGLCMVSQQPEIINVRLEFDNGSAANITCDIVAANDEYYATIVLRNKIIKCDLLNNELTSWNVDRSLKTEVNPLPVETRCYRKKDSLEEELMNFISTIQPPPKYTETGDLGFEPFVLADRISEKIRKSLIQFA